MKLSHLVKFLILIVGEIFWLLRTAVLALLSFLNHSHAVKFMVSDLHLYSCNDCELPAPFIPIC